MPPLLLFSLLFAGCAPEEKTLLLPQATSAADESQDTASGRDYTVKKIYTYSYETGVQLGKSAFLTGCGENEVRILSAAGEDGEEKLECRQVDYRYGFYDVVGDYLEVWDNWHDPADGEMAGDLYIDQMLPSPDGTQLLVYIRSAFWDKLTVCLYTLDGGEPLVLYDGTGDTLGFFRGAFSPDGRWVTFDAAGISTASTRLVPIYDCSQTASRDLDTWAIEETASSLLAPDQVLYSPEPKAEKTRLWIWDAGLYDNQAGPGLINLVQEEDSDSLFVREDTFLPGEAIKPDSSLIEEKTPAPDFIFHSEQYLLGYQGLPYPIYQYSGDGATVHYLSHPLTLWSIDMEELREETVRDFPNYVWDFVALSSGDILAALIKESKNDYAQDPDMNTEQYTQESSIPAALQEYWGILSADLYLYPAGSEEGHLLYKNLQNLISMEYDEATDRILLETYTDQDRSTRRCILLEL